MTKKLMRKRQEKGTYLNPDFADVQEALEDLNDIEWVLCDDENCNGMGSPGDPCPICRFVLPNPKGTKMPIQINSAIKNGGASSSTGSTGTLWQGWKSDPPCNHRGHEIVYESGNKKLYASSGIGLDEFCGRWNLIIDLAKNIRWPDSFGFVREKSNPKFNVLRKYTYLPPKVKSEVLELDWPDMGTPACSLDFWLKLWDMLPEKTVVACVGGHGRTGTCIASLMIADGQDYYTAVEHVRTVHCHKAIESLSQEKYLHALYVEMLKRNIKAEKDPKELAALNEDLAYAEEYVPNNYDSFGAKEPPKETKVQEVSSKGSAKTESKTDAEDLAVDKLKLIGNTLYEQMCVQSDCRTPHCAEPLHQGWIEYDPQTDTSLWGN